MRVTEVTVDPCYKEVWVPSLDTLVGLLTSFKSPLFTERAHKATIKQVLGQVKSGQTDWPITVHGDSTMGVPLRVTVDRQPAGEQKRRWPLSPQPVYSYTIQTGEPSWSSPLYAHLAADEQTREKLIFVAVDIATAIDSGMFHVDMGYVLDALRSAGLTADVSGEDAIRQLCYNRQRESRQAQLCSGDVLVYATVMPGLLGPLDQWQPDGATLSGPSAHGLTHGPAALRDAHMLLSITVPDPDGQDDGTYDTEMQQYLSQLGTAVGAALLPA